MHEFFSRDSVSRNMRALEGFLEGSNQTNFDARLIEHLSFVVRVFSANNGQFDSHCQISIQKLGHLLPDVHSSIASPNPLNIPLFAAVFYAFVTEFDISTNEEISSELQQFKDIVEQVIPNTSPQAKAILEFAQKRLPTLMLKNLLADQRVKDLKNVPEVVSAIEVKVKNWQNDLRNKASLVKGLQKTLERQENAFNFVGLYNGFDELSKKKAEELASAQTMMMWTGGALFIPISVDIVFLMLHYETLGNGDGIKIGAIAAATFSVTFLLIYFFRIFMRSADLCKAQLLQINFRKTLCQFVQRYVKYADELKANKELLGKFESVIFSPISFGDEKAPIIFEGLDQFSAFVPGGKGK